MFHKDRAELAACEQPFMQFAAICKGNSSPKTIKFMHNILRMAIAIYSYVQW